jgi:hypothetical protein
MSRPTHAGGVVFRLTAKGPRYLLVEAGVRARPIRRLRPVGRKKAGERIYIAYFLMAYAGRTTPLEKRKVRWFAFDEALEALRLEKSRRVLRSADRLVWAALVAAVSIAVTAGLAVVALLAA